MSRRDSVFVAIVFIMETDISIKKNKIREEGRKEGRKEEQAGQHHVPNLILKG